jgi:hypothetical protein
MALLFGMLFVIKFYTPQQEKKQELNLFKIQNVYNLTIILIIGASPLGLEA